MDLVESLARFVVGGALITFVSFLGDTEYSVFSGLAVLFPIVTLTGYYFLSLEVPRAELREVVLFSALGVPTVWGFVLGFYVASARLPIPAALLVGLLAWFAVAAVVIAVDRRWTSFVL